MDTGSGSLSIFQLHTKMALNMCATGTAGLWLFDLNKWIEIRDKGSLPCLKPHKDILEFNTKE